jgi:hypothetical protein
MNSYSFGNLETPAKTLPKVKPVKNQYMFKVREANLEVAKKRRKQMEKE